ncbi:Fc.00g022660.m01.CDS01 [Cosmosporella sp. VM-42]
MPSFRSTILALAASFIAVTHADYVIDPNSVPLSTRQNWCQNEKYTCPVICQQFGDGTTKVNECDPKSLTYGCICGNGKQPNVSEYSLTLPFFVCQEWGNQCVSDCGDNNHCASSCRQDHPCGALDPKKYNTTSTATGTNAVKATASATDDGSVIYTDVSSGDDSGDDSSDDSSNDSGSSKSSGDKPGAAAALEVGRTWGLTVVMGSMFLGFALL